MRARVYVASCLYVALHVGGVVIIIIFVPQCSCCARWPKWEVVEIEAEDTGRHRSICAIDELYTPSPSHVDDTISRPKLCSRWPIRFDNFRLCPNRVEEEDGFPEVWK